MSTIGLTEGFLIAVLGGLYYAFVIFCIWKFYQILCRINDNLAGINENIIGLRRAGIEDSERTSGPASSDVRAQPCPGCGLKVLPTAAGRCPSCQVPIP
jgi:hypothetical protein